MSLEVHCCKTCGNLWKQGGSTDSLEYAGEDYRNTGQADWHAHNPHPRCHRQVDLKGEWLAAIETFGSDNNANRKAAVAVIHRPRSECQQWRVFNHGKTPKEHDEMDVQQFSLNLQRQLNDIHADIFAWQKNQADRDEKWGSRIQALEQVRHNENLSVAKWQFFLALAGFIFSVILGVLYVVDHWRRWFPSH